MRCEGSILGLEIKVKPPHRNTYTYKRKQISHSTGCQPRFGQPWKRSAHLSIPLVRFSKAHQTVGASVFNFYLKTRSFRPLYLPSIVLLFRFTAWVWCGMVRKPHNALRFWMVSLCLAHPFFLAYLLSYYH